MPELPEVETICNYLKATINNSSIQQVIIRQPDLRWPVETKLANDLKNSCITHIQRRAKYLLIDCYHQDLNKYNYLIIHMGMSGRLVIVNNDTKLDKHDHVDFILTNDRILRYNDPRRFGAIILTDQNPLEHKLLINLGLEPFAPSFNENYLLQQACGKNLIVKQFIMDNKIVVGIGNIYANEALFAANIHPMSKVKNFTFLQFAKLIYHVKQILAQAINQGGTSLRDFLTPAGTKGTFARSLRVYNRSGQPCLVCGDNIAKMILAGRSTFFCATCQTII